MMQQCSKPLQPAGPRARASPLAGTGRADVYKLLRCSSSTAGACGARVPTTAALSLQAAANLSPQQLGPAAAPAGSASWPLVVRTPLRPTPPGRRALPAAPVRALPELLAAAEASPYRDAICVAAAAVGAFIWVKIFDILAVNGILEQKLSRKIVHTTTGPLFILTWPLFSAAPIAKLLASIVPALNLTRLLAVGLGAVQDPGLVKSVSRSGDRTELLKGPLYYCIILIAATLLCWRDNPAGLVAISLMCGGDGLADIVGRRLGAAASARLPYNTNKSYAGSVAMFLGGFLMSWGLVHVFCNLGFFACYNVGTLVPCLAFISLVSTIVESLPINQVIDDNISVPGVAAGLSLLLLPAQVVAVGVPVQVLGLPVL